MMSYKKGNSAHYYLGVEFSKECSWICVCVFSGISTRKLISRQRKAKSTQSLVGTLHSILTDKTQQDRKSEDCHRCAARCCRRSMGKEQVRRGCKHSW